MEDVKEPQKTETDDKGVPLSNRLKEFERRMEDKYSKELEETRKELAELRSSMPQPKTELPQEDAAKADLMEFVRDPRGFVNNSYQQAEFQRQIPEAEAWIRGQTGFKTEDESRIAQIVSEYKLNTPYHTPMERARTSWRLLQAEKREQVLSSEEDRRTVVKTEGGGKSAPKESSTTRADIIHKLALAEQKGDLEAATRYLNQLEDIRE